MQTISKLEIYMSGKHVGTMSPIKRYLTAFEYSDDWFRNGFSISPFSLPLEPGVRVSKMEPFGGIWGVFADSLPDGWGRLLVDRMLRKSGENPEEIGNIERLSIVGESGMGALEYRPIYEKPSTIEEYDLDYLSMECSKILKSEESSDLDTLYSLGGSSGGARPKVLIEEGADDWVVKFPSSMDPADIGEMEYEYNLCAAACEIEVPEVRLFSSDLCSGYFGSKRFDRKNSADGVSKLHMCSASALLEVSHRIPSLDYSALMSLTWQLTKSAHEAERMFRLMCFNVFAHNRDDHSNNFSFICENGSWRLSPAYDLTYSNSIGGEHATTINGKGKNISIKDILAVAKMAGIKESDAREIAEFTEEIVYKKLRKYL